MKARHWAYAAVVFLLLAASGMAQTASVAPSSLSFGNQPAAVASAPKTVTLTNSSGTVLAISSIAVSGIHASNFYQVNNCGSSLAANSSCTVTVEVVPSEAGVRTASLVVTDNAPGSPQRVPLSATGMHDIILSWTASVSSGVIGYYVYRGTKAGGGSTTPVNVIPVNALFYVDTQVVKGITYYYVVTATTGSAQSGPSNEAHAKVGTQSSVIIN